MSAAARGQFMSIRRFVLLIAVLLPFLAFSQQSPAKSPLDPLKFFVGHWQGTSKGEPGNGKGERDYEFVLGGKFLQAKNKTVYPPQEKNPKGETHEDMGLFSYDSHEKRLVLRQFHVEGFVNEYVEQARSHDGTMLMFATERIENIPAGWRARETYRILNRNEFSEVFELAEPDKEFTVYAESRWKRVK